MQTLILDTTTKTIKAKMSGAAATTNPDFVASWADDTGTSFVEGSTDGALNGTSDVTLVAAPASSTRRVIKSLTISNRDTAPVTITLIYDNNGTQRILEKVTLAVNDTFTLTGTYDVNGYLKAGFIGPTGYTGPIGATGYTGYTGPAGSTTTITLTASPTSQTATGIKVSWTYGESITLGDLLYYKSDGKVYKADATSLATAKYPVLGLALATASSGANDVLLRGIYKDSTKWTGGTALTVGGICYSSATAGGTTQTQPSSADNIIQIVGIATATDTIYFNPSPDFITHT